MTVACLATSQAAEKIRYEEISKRLAPFGTVLAFRGFSVTTADGKQHEGRRMLLESDHLRIFQGDTAFEDLPSGEVSRIEISQGGRFFHHIVGPAQLPVAGASIICGGLEDPACLVPATAAFSPLWAYTAATAPFYLIADGVAFLIPPKVYEIVH